MGLRYLWWLLLCWTWAPGWALPDLTAEEAVERLFGRVVDVEEWVGDFLGRRPVFASGDSDRSKESRVQWIRDYRSFFRGENLDRFLKLNQTAFTDTLGSSWSFLRYDADVVMYRLTKEKDGWFPRRLQSFWPQVLDNSSVPLELIHRRFKEGFSLEVQRLQYSSQMLAEYCRAIESLLGVSVEASLSVHPGGGQGVVRLDFHSWDSIWIQLDGSQTVSLYRSLLTRPYPHQEFAPTAVQLGSVSKTFLLREGDVLYIPRGHAFDVQVEEGLSLSVNMRIHTSSLTYRDAILIGLDQVVRWAVDKDDFVILRPVHSKFSFSWKDVLSTFVRVIADVTEDLRETFPFKPELLTILSGDDETPFDVESELLRRLDSMVQAASGEPSAAFEPLLDVLANDETADTYGSRELQKWAVYVLNQGMAAIQENFQIFSSCLGTLTAHVNPSRIYQTIRLANDHYGMRISDRYNQIYEHHKLRDKLWKGAS
mmetsp:Transcript_4473/g.8892  ORF Transcript_4473/g.8892 Transcript_4473/m.8892 type:complete len:483 (-) Transcript_4473:2708-4156(-)